MVQAPKASMPEIEYPDSDGKPMADNTLQFQWIVTIKENCEQVFADNPQVFVTGDLLWYPVEGNNKLCQAPDTMIVFGRPKGYRGSYQQWKEDNIPPQVVVEILSPGNRLKEMAKKFAFYQTYGVEEYYLYDPDRNDLTGWIRRNSVFVPIEELEQWISPRLQVRFSLAEAALTMFYPDGERFLTFSELADRARQATQRAHQEAERADQEAQRADQEAQRVEQLMAQLRALGVEPEV
ncbi:MAG: Uma2 family endonuclease [Synechococcales bacterium]|nr:Uma2 family endonuclease [Synechococcales bacterium]